MNKRERWIVAALVVVVLGARVLYGHFFYNDWTCGFVNCVKAARIR